MVIVLLCHVIGHSFCYLVFCVVLCFCNVIGQCHNCNIFALRTLSIKIVRKTRRKMRTEIENKNEK